MRCRVCHGGSFGDVLDLGPMPLVNDLLDDPGAVCRRWPLRVVFCRDCSLVQLTESAPPDLMFRRYCYFSSQSRTMVEHARALVDRFVRPGQRVVEVASNDGYLLESAIARGASVLGVDPAENVAEHARRRGVPTRCSYFDPQTAAEIRRDFGAADVLFANNVLAHTDDPHAIAAGIAAVLAPGGIAHIEVPYVVRLIESCAFDTIYHEHHSYFSVSALRALFAPHALRIAEVEEIPIHGGSLHVQVVREDAETDAVADAVAVAHAVAHTPPSPDAFCAAERRGGLFADAYYAGFGARVERLRTALLETIDGFDVVAAYGAAAKGVVLLNTFGLDRTRIPWVADVSPHKQGRWIPGTGQPIVPPEQLRDERPDACLLLPWNLREEITRSQHAYIESGGAFIVPLPEVEIVRAAPAAVV